MSELFSLIDTIIINVILIVVVGGIGLIIYSILSAEMDYKEYERKKKEKEEIRQRRLKKLPKESWKCSNCNFGTRRELSDMVVYECSHPRIEAIVIESQEIGCQYFDPELGAFLD